LVDEKINHRYQQDKCPSNKTAHREEQKDYVEENLFHACLQKGGVLAASD
jgi:hypothetical protein